MGRCIVRKNNIADHLQWKVQSCPNSETQMVNDTAQREVMDLYNSTVEHLLVCGKIIPPTNTMAKVRNPAFMSSGKRGVAGTKLLWSTY
ncbi:hypothetical protein RvY_05297 [Ramazzottius varieornatus]|uniref:Uncharacterized protein n=1 Tax=Ramazzottius varieornatus TaxID=947166 RepID=A0A1D1V072_RAMVA|nr:hypothetical protein RvY_05297 [Ramazzottius varieornatus]